ncbi:MAG: L,D-transpeptidase family protein, partial [Actinomycetota bacterium]
MSDETPTTGEPTENRRPVVWPGYGALEHRESDAVTAMNEAVVEPTPPATEEIPAAAPTPTREVISTGSGWTRFFRPGRRIAVVLSIVGVLLMLAAGAMAYVGHQYSQKYEGKIFPGSTIAGVDVGGMTEKEARRAVRDALQPQLERTITITHEDKTWEVTPKDLGATSDARSRVKAALEESDTTSFLQNIKMGVLGDELDFSSDVALKYPKEGINGFIRGIAESYDKEAQNESIDYSTGWIEFTKPKEGRQVRQRASRGALAAALDSGADTVDLSVETIEPTANDTYDQVILVHIGENKVYLYQDGKITHEYLVATGQPEYPTPTGEYEITEKRYMPTWINPSPDGWGASMPESIPPGISNPLGLRALNWSAPAIRFHGTQATYSLGYNASHGCVRLSNDDVIELYDLVDVGTPIISVNFGSYDPLYTSTSVVDQETTATEEADEAADSAESGSSGSGKKGDSE